MNIGFLNSVTESRNLFIEFEGNWAIFQLHLFSNFLSSFTLTTNAHYVLEHMGIKAQTKCTFLYDSFSTDTGNVKGQYRGTSLVMGQRVGGIVWPAVLGLFVNLLQTFFLYKKWSASRYLGYIPRKILIRSMQRKDTQIYIFSIFHRCFYVSVLKLLDRNLFPN